MPKPPDACCYGDGWHEEQRHKDEQPEVVSSRHPVTHQNFKHQQQDMEPHGNEHCFELHTRLPFGPDKEQINHQKVSLTMKIVMTEDAQSKHNSRHVCLRSNCEFTCTGGCAPRLQCQLQPQWWPKASTAILGWKRPSNSTGWLHPAVRTAAQRRTADRCRSGIYWKRNVQMKKKQLRITVLIIILLMWGNNSLVQKLKMVLNSTSMEYLKVF